MSTEVRADPPGFAYTKLEAQGRRAVLADHFIEVKTDADAFSLVVESNIDVTRSPVLLPEAAAAAKALLGAAAATPPAKDAERPGEARVIRDDGNRCEFEVDARRDAILFVADNYFPNFEATVDGEKTEIWRANYSYRALPVKQGKHRVEFRWRPYDFQAGAALTALSVIGLAATVALGRGASKASLHS